MIRKVLWIIGFGIVGAALVAFGQWVGMPIGTKGEAPGDFIWRTKLSAFGDVFGVFFLMIAALPIWSAVLSRRRQAAKRGGSHHAD